jgi:hypothetical protein
MTAGVPPFCQLKTGALPTDLDSGAIIVEEHIAVDCCTACGINSFPGAMFWTSRSPLIVVECLRAVPESC